MLHLCFTRATGETESHQTHGHLPLTRLFPFPHGKGLGVRLARSRPAPRVILERSESLPCRRESRLRMRTPNMRRGRWVSHFLWWEKKPWKRPALSEYSESNGRLLEVLK